MNFKEQSVTLLKHTTKVIIATWILVQNDRARGHGCLTRVLNTLASLSDAIFYGHQLKHHVSGHFCHFCLVEE